MLCALGIVPEASAQSTFVKDEIPNCSVAKNVASSVPRTTPTIRLARAAVCLINEQRVNRGLPKLHLNSQLNQAAIWHTHDMVRRDYFGHISGRGRDVVDRLYDARYLGGRFDWAVGENLAWGVGSLGSPKSIVHAWMDSPGHRRNMLDGRYREIGIGVIADSPTQSGQPAATYTTTFGIRR